jgi:hypothetical protein
VGDTGAVNEFCTCGARLAQDALFCHKCGRPQRDIQPADTEEPVTPIVIPKVAPVETAPPEIGFQNRLAVRIALVCAIGSTFLSAVPMPMLMSALWKLVVLVVAGFLAVYFYHRRTGAFLTVRGGVRMGWLTGTFCAVIAIALLAFSMLVIAYVDEVATMFREQMRSQGGANADEFLRALESPGGIAITLLLTWFVSCLLPVLGGALCAKVLERE